ncbi:MAG: ABC transporter ATP-binding protein [Actinomycetota bacterium]|nr:ABC transporter ATP-binding protein [Actinomycetota bacterium]MDQ3628244.1 ABC transporter ATP-binding protein [Actinomycetota bacterium]
MPESGAREVLDVRDLTVEYDDVVALHEVSVGVASAEVLALLGPSGSGKSTLLYAVAGFRPPSSGEIWLHGRLVASARRAEPPERRDVAVVFQNYALWPHLSVIDTVAYPARRRGLPRAQAHQEARTVLQRLRIAHLADRRPAELSGGEQQRVGLARALARKASLYLFDEPTAHLDTHVRALFLAELVSRQRASGAGAVYATHDAEEALGLADRVALLNSGRIVQIGTPEQVYNEPADLWAARLTGPASVLVEGDRRLLVRPGWASLGGDLTARVSAVWFRGPHSDHLVQTATGSLLIREPGPPRCRVDEEVSWSLHRHWLLGT